MSIDTIIVNYNAGDALQECVAALLGSSQHSNLTVVDNASEDGSAIMPLKMAVQKGCKISMATNRQSSFYLTPPILGLPRRSMRSHGVQLPTGS
jgi:hypothetical protein